MKGDKTEVLYVGKAKDLKKRVSSYFSRSTNIRYQVKFLLSHVKSADYILTENEKEALILENNLIKRYKPRYNVYFRDDKTYYSLKVTSSDEFPGIAFVRKIRNDGSVYFGPYSSSVAMKETIGYLLKIFPLRTCSNTHFRNRTRPCLNYQIKRCSGPCCNLISKAAYDEYVKNAILFLSGRNKELLQHLKKKMLRLSSELMYEEAATLRDMIKTIETTLKSQRVISPNFLNQDVFGIDEQTSYLAIQIVFVRGGKVLETKSFTLKHTGIPIGEAMSSIVKQFYHNTRFIPDEILLSEDVEDKELISEWLSMKKGKKVSVLYPKRGYRKKLIEMAVENAKAAMLKVISKDEQTHQALVEVKQRLRLTKVPRKIECFDVSNIMGSVAVGAKITFVDGQPMKSDYKRYRIRGEQKINDYALLKEVLSRRFAKLSKSEMPDLIVVDGGKGQLGILQEVLKELSITTQDVVSIAKGKSQRRRSEEHKYTDELYIPGQKNSVRFPTNSPGLFILQNARNEAHRFAISYHRRLKKSKDISSILDSIPGIGTKRKGELLKRYKNISDLKSAQKEGLEKIPGMNKEIASRVVRFLSRIPLDNSVTT